MVMVTSNFSQLLAPGMNAIIDQGFEEVEDILDMFFIVEDSKRAYEEEMGITGLGTFVQTGELGATSYDDKYTRYLKRYTHLKYVLGIAVSREMMEDDLYNQIAKYSRDLGRSARETPQTLGFDIFNRAFNASYTGADGKVLCATDHPKKPFGTWSNRPSTSADISYTSLAQAKIDMRSWTNDRGLVYNSEPRVLLGGVAQDQKFYELTKSEYNPEAVERVSNYIKSMNLQYKTTPYISSAKAWFLLTAKQYTYLKLFWKKRFATEFWDDHNQGAMRARGEFRVSVGWTEPWGIYGDDGI